MYRRIHTQIFILFFILLVNGCQKSEEDLAARKIPTTLYLTLPTQFANQSPQIGDSVTFLATLKPQNQNEANNEENKQPILNSQIDFKITDGTGNVDNDCTSQPLTNGLTVTCKTVFAHPKIYYVQASYSGNEDYQPSISNVIQLNITQIKTDLKIVNGVEGAHPATHPLNIELVLKRTQPKNFTNDTLTSNASDLFIIEKLIEKENIENKTNQKYWENVSGNTRPCKVSLKLNLENIPTQYEVICNYKNPALGHQTLRVKFLGDENYAQTLSDETEVTVTKNQNTCTTLESSSASANMHVGDPQDFIATVHTTCPPKLDTKKTMTQNDTLTGMVSFKFYNSQSEYKIQCSGTSGSKVKLVKNQASCFMAFEHAAEYKSTALYEPDGLYDESKSDEHVYSVTKISTKIEPVTPLPSIQIGSSFEFNLILSRADEKPFFSEPEGIFELLPLTDGIIGEGSCIPAMPPAQNTYPMHNDMISCKYTVTESSQTISSFDLKVSFTPSSEKARETYFPSATTPLEFSVTHEKSTEVEVTCDSGSNTEINQKVVCKAVVASLEDGEWKDKPIGSSGGKISFSVKNNKGEPALESYTELCKNMSVADAREIGCNLYFPNTQIYTIYADFTKEPHLYKGHIGYTTYTPGKIASQLTMILPDDVIDDTVLSINSPLQIQVELSRRGALLSEYPNGKLILSEESGNSSPFINKQSNCCICKSFDIQPINGKYTATCEYSIPAGKHEQTLKLELQNDAIYQANPVFKKLNIEYPMDVDITGSPFFDEENPYKVTLTMTVSDSKSTLNANKYTNSSYMKTIPKAPKAPEGTLTSDFPLCTNLVLMPQSDGLSSAECRFTLDKESQVIHFTFTPTRKDYYADKQQKIIVEIDENKISKVPYIDFSEPSPPGRVGNPVTLTATFRVDYGFESRLRALEIARDTKFEEEINGKWVDIPCAVKEVPQYENEYTQAQCTFTPSKAYERDYRINYNEQNMNHKYLPTITKPISIKISKYPVTINLTNNLPASRGSFAVGETINLIAEVNGIQPQYRQPLPYFIICHETSCMEHAGCARAAQNIKAKAYQNTSQEPAFFCSYDYTVTVNDYPALTFTTKTQETPEYTDSTSNTITVPIEAPMPQILIISPAASNFDKDSKSYIYNQYSSESWQSNPEHTGKLQVQIVGTWFNKNVNTIPKNELTLTIQSMDVLENYIFQDKNDRIQSGSKEFKPVCEQINTEQAELRFACNFLPLVNKFRLNFQLNYGKESETNYVDIYIMPTNKPHMWNTNYTASTAPADGCGLHGTLRQRMFDCSMKVDEYQGAIIEVANGTPYSKNGKQFNPYPGSHIPPTKLWHLVRCPKGSGAGQGYRCSWLSPYINEQIATNDRYLSYNPSSTVNNNTEWVMRVYQGSLVFWSGMNENTTNLKEVNPNQWYLYPMPAGGKTNYALSIDKKIAWRSGVYDWGNDPCVKNTRTYNWTEDENQGGLWLPRLDFIATRGEGMNNWLVPSYPQIYELRQHSAWYVPGFYRAGITNLWSSGAKDNDNGWVYNTQHGIVDWWQASDKNQNGGMGFRCAIMVKPGEW